MAICKNCGKDHGKGRIGVFILDDDDKVIDPVPAVRFDDMHEAQEAAVIMGDMQALMNRLQGKASKSLVFACDVDKVDLAVADLKNMAKPESERKPAVGYGVLLKIDDKGTKTYTMSPGETQVKPMKGNGNRQSPVDMEPVTYDDLMDALAKSAPRSRKEIMGL